MKLKPILLAIAMAATTIVSASAFADATVVSDAVLDTIMGADNGSFVGGVDNTTVSGVNANGNIQLAYYQWSDNHSADTSVNKGANNQAGDGAMVQQNATSIANALAWGAISQSVTTNNATVGHDQRSESWAVMYIGGF